MPKAKGKKLSTGIWLIKWKRNKERVFFGHPPRKDDFMFANIIEFCRYWFVLLFGTTVAVSFAGLERTKKNILAIGIMTNALFILQLIALLLFGFDNVLKLYPVLSHIPLLSLSFLHEAFLGVSVTCIAVSYLCSHSAGSAAWQRSYSKRYRESHYIHHCGFYHLLLSIQIRI